MALVVETGAIISGANVYMTLATCDEYHVTRGNTTWKGSDSAKEFAMIKGCQYCDDFYRMRMKGAKVEVDQPMLFPRDGLDDEDGFAYDNDAIPLRWVWACCEASLLYIASVDPLPSLERGGALKSEKYDVIEFEYFEGAQAKTVYQKIDYLVAPFLTSATGGQIAILDIARA